MATLKLLDSGAWRLTWSDAQGQHRRVIGHRSWMSRNEAQAKLRDVEYQLAVGRGQAPAAAPAFETYAEEYIAWHASEFPASTPRISQLITHHLVPKFGA